MPPDGFGEPNSRVITLLLQSQPKGEVECFVICADNLHQPESHVTLLWEMVKRSE